MVIERTLAEIIPSYHIDDLVVTYEISLTPKELYKAYLEQKKQFAKSDIAENVVWMFERYGKHVPEDIDLQEFAENIVDDVIDDVENDDCYMERYNEIVMDAAHDKLAEMGVEV